MKKCGKSPEKRKLHRRRAYKGPIPRTSMAGPVRFAHRKTRRNHFRGSWGGGIFCFMLRFALPTSLIPAIRIRMDEREAARFIKTLHFLTETHHFTSTSTRRASSRYAGETRTRASLQQRMREKGQCAAPAYVHSAHAAYCCWSTAFSPHPACSADCPHGPCLAPA